MILNSPTGIEAVVMAILLMEEDFAIVFTSVTISVYQDLNKKKKKEINFKKYVEFTGFL